MSSVWFLLLVLWLNIFIKIPLYNGIFVSILLTLLILQTARKLLLGIIYIMNFYKKMREGVRGREGVREGVRVGKD